MTPAPAHGDGPTRPSAPTGHTALRDRIAEALTARFIARHGSADEIIRSAHRDHADAILPVVEAETAALRERAENAEDRLRKATDAYTRLHAEATGAESTGERWRARAEEAEARLAELEGALTWQTSCLSCSRLLDASYADRQRAEEAEARNRQYDTAIATERRGRLTAEAAVRRARELARNRIAVPTDVLREALTIEQPEETP